MTASIAQRPAAIRGTRLAQLALAAVLAAGCNHSVLIRADATDDSSSYQNALRAVLEHNERQEAEFEDRHPDAP